MTSLDRGHLLKTLISSELLAAIDEWRGQQPVPPTRSEVIRRAIFAFLESHTWRREPASVERGNVSGPWGGTAVDR